MDNEDYAGIIERLRDEARSLLSRGPLCHGWDHTLRVLDNARGIWRNEGGDLAVIECSALLHDIGRAHEEEDCGKSCHAAIGAELVPEIMRAAGFEDEEFIKHVAACVLTHRYRSRDDEIPASIEARVIFDGDKLDAIGAIGIGRAFHFAGRIGARVHNTEAEAIAGESWGLEDSAYREYLVKLKHIPVAMLTETGKKMAAERCKFMDEFFRRLNAETGKKQGS